MSRRAWIAAALAAVLAGAVRADELPEQPVLSAAPSLGDRMADKVELFGNDVGLRLNALTFDLVALHFDAQNRTARVRLGGSFGDKLSLRLDGNVAFQSGLARVSARIDLGLAGKRLALDLPDFEMVPRSLDGQRYVEVRVPVVQLHF